MQSFRLLDRFSPSEAYLLTLLAAHHLEMIREEQLLMYLDRGMGVANRDARSALLESALLRSNEIEELEHYLERKLERGPRDYRVLCRSMFTPGVERVLRNTRNDDARRLTLDTPTTGPTEQTAGSGGSGSSVGNGTDWDDEPEPEAKAPSHPWIKASIAIGLLLLVGLAAVMPMDRQPAGMQLPNDALPNNRIAPTEDDMLTIVRVLYLIHGERKEVIAQLTKDPNLTEDRRNEALGIAKDTPNISLLLNDSPWYVVRCPGCPQSSYQRCLALSTEAVRLAPDDGMILNTLGVAQYRVGLYKEAIETLNQSNEMNATRFRVGEQPADVAFLCMAYARLGRSDEAKQQFASLNRLMKMKRWRDQPESEAFSKEAAEVMRQSQMNKSA